jgi:hypothetical protein
VRRRAWSSGVAVGLLVLIALLAGCGGGRTEATASPDPFVGTWREPDYKTAYTTPLVIAPSPGGYQATLVTSKGDNVFALTRSGNKLSGTIQLGGGPFAIEATYVPASGHLLVRNGKKPHTKVFGAPVELIRVSTATVPPSKP